MNKDVRSIRGMISLMESIDRNLSEKENINEANVAQSLLMGAEALEKGLRDERSVADKAVKKYISAGMDAEAAQAKAMAERPILNSLKDEIKNSNSPLLKKAITDGGGSLESLMGKISRDKDFFIKGEGQEIAKELRNLPSVKDGMRAFITKSPTFATLKSEVLPKGINMPHDPVKLGKLQILLKNQYGFEPSEVNSLFGLPKDAKTARIPQTLSGVAKSTEAGAAADAKSIESSKSNVNVNPGASEIKVEPGKIETINGEPIDVANVDPNKIGAEQIKTAETAEEAAANTKATTTESGVSPETAETLTENGENVKKINNWTKFKDFASRNFNKKTLFALGILGGGIYMLKRLFGGYTSNDIPKWNSCMTDLINNGGNNVKLKATSKGDAVIAVTTSERYPELDAKGGLWFFMTGRVMSADNGDTKRGTWSCPGGQMNISESNILNEDALGDIEIVWDGENPTPEPTPIPNPEEKPLYKDCNDFPFTIGCKSDKIIEIQKCLGMESGYQTGNFGPATKQALIDKKINDGSTITQDDYNKIMSSCGGNNEPEDVKIGPTPKVGEVPAEEVPKETKPVEEKPIEPTKPEESAEEMYQRFVGEGYFRSGEIGDNRVKYKGPDLNQENLDKLNSYLKQNGYSFMKEKDKGTQYGDGNDEKYVWKKIR